MHTSISAEQDPIWPDLSEKTAMTPAEVLRFAPRAVSVQAVEALTREHHLLLSLVYYEQLSFYEAAAVLGQEEARVRTLHDDAIKILSDCCLA